jgi:hypothetical protein
VRTAIANGIDPEKYFVTILERWRCMNTARDVQTLVPWALKAEWEAERRLTALRAA